MALLCELLAVSKSGYYDWQSRQSQPGPRALQDQMLRARIKAIHEKSRRTYGSPRVRAALLQAGERHGRNRIARLMKEQGLFGRQKRRWRVRTTDSNHAEPIAPNRLAVAGPPHKPHQIWVGDITYIQTSEGWLYLAAILDLYTRKVVGWNMSAQIDSALVSGALAMALARHPARSERIFHSDRGIQYACGTYRRALARAGLLASMSRKANCYDNATMESFWSTLKFELVYRTEFQNRGQARSAIFDYIETFYNRQRAHSALSYLSPVDFELQNN